MKKKLTAAAKTLNNRVISAVNAVSTGHLEDVPVDISLFATSATGGLNRNSAIATFAARNIDEEPGRAAAIIANELREAEAKSELQKSEFKFNKLN